MIPILFPYNATEFTTHGVGDLMETMRCESALNSDGEYELELEYPADGRYTSQLLIDNIIVAKVNDHQQNQAFRIYSIEKTINRTILVRAQHLSYDLKYWLHDPFWARTCSGAVRELRYAIGSDGAFNFNITTDVPNSTPAQNIDQKLKIEEPKSVRAILLDGDNSIKGTFGCDLIFDNWDIFLAKVGGADRGVLIEYGIDMVDMQQEENISEMITGVYPYWKGSQSQGENEEQQDVPYTNIYVDDPDDDSDDSNVVIPGDVIYAQGNFKRHHIIPLNISEYWVEDNRFPTRDEINEIARNWITANHIGEPAINLTISYAALPKNKNIRIHDAVTVNFVKMGIQTTAKVEEYKYDVLKERCIEITVGKAKPTILFDLEDASRLKRGLIPPKRIQNKSIQSQHIEPHTLESFQLSDGVVQSLGYADQFNAATLEDPVYETLPEHFSAKEMSILPQEGLDPLTLLNGVEATNLFLTVGKNVRIGETIYAQNFIVTIDRGIMESPMFCFPENENGEVIIAERAGYNVNHHTHALTADDNGRVHIGKPDFLGKDNFFNIADTKFFKDKMSAVIIVNATASITAYPLQYYGTKDPNSAKILVTYKTSQDGADKTMPLDLNVKEVYDAGETAGKAYATPTSIVRRTNLATGQPMPDSWNNNTNTGYIFVRAKNNAGDIYKDDTLEVTTDSAIYQAGLHAGTTTITNASITAYPLQYYGTKDPNSAKILVYYTKNGEMDTVPLDLNVKEVYDAGETAGKAYATPTSIVRRTNLATGQPMPDSWNNNTNTGYIYVRAKNNAEDIYKDDTLEVTTDSAIYQAGVTAGKADAGMMTITEASITAYPLQYYGTKDPNSAKILVYYTKNGETDTVPLDLNVKEVYEAGVTAGKAGGGTPIAKFYLEYTGIWYRTNYGNFYEHRICSVTQVNDEYVSESTPRLIYIVGNTYDGYYD